jgi:hypothetical protein
MTKRRGARAQVVQAGSRARYFKARLRHIITTGKVPNSCIIRVNGEIKMKIATLANK